MSKRHQTSRRRSYGRRQHELHERMDSIAAVIDWLDDSRARDTTYIWDRMAGLGRKGATWPAPGGIE
jgi:hypothetical protein